MKIFRNIVLVCFLVISVVFGIFEFGVYRNSDSTAPVITADSDAVTVSVYDDDAAYTAGMKAEDDRDGDVTDSITVTAKSYFISDTTFRVNYAAFDSHNNVASYSRMVTFSDYTSPRFAISAPMRFLNSGTSISYTANITAEDVVDGDLTNDIKVISQGYYDYASEVSTIPLTLQVTNSLGDIQEISISATVETSSTYNQPAPALSSYLVYTNVNEGLDFWSYAIGIWSGGITQTFDQSSLYSAGNIQIDTSRIDFSVPGTYTVSYMLVSNGTVLGTTDMYVVVEG